MAALVAQLPTLPVLDQALMTLEFHECRKMYVNAFPSEHTTNKNLC